MGIVSGKDINVSTKIRMGDIWMKYKIIVSIDSDKELNASNLQQIKNIIEDVVIENLIKPSDTSVYIDTRLIKV